MAKVGTNQDLAELQEFRQLLAGYATTSRSDKVRLALGDLIVTFYSAGKIDRAEYQSAMWMVM